MILVTDRRGVVPYTVDDINRVESTVQSLSRRAVDLDIHLTPAVKANWSQSDGWINRTQAQRYLSNVQELVNACGLRSRLPMSMDRLTWQGANDIERALQGVAQRIDAVTSAFEYSGELIAREV